MEVSLKSLLLAGIGVMTYTYEKSMDMVDELVRKGELTVSQAKELTDELKRKDSGDLCRKQGGAAGSMENIRDIIAGLNLATKDDIMEIHNRLTELENK